MRYRIQPIKFTTIDGEERQALLSAGALERHITRCGVRPDEGNALRSMISLLYESLFPGTARRAISIEDFSDVLPPDPTEIAGIINQLQGEHGSENPPAPADGADSTGSNLGPSGPPSSGDDPQSTTA